MAKPKLISLVRSLKAEHSVFHRFAWSPTGRYVAAACNDTVVRIWAYPSGELLQRIASDVPQVTNVSWSPDGDLLAFASADIKVFNVQEQRVIATLSGHRHSVWDMSWAPDGRILASGSHDKSVILWNTITMTAESELAGHADEVLSVRWSPNGRQLASASSDGTIRIWDREGGMSRVLKRHVGPVTCLAWTPDGRMLASGSTDRTLVLWNAEHGWPTHILERHTTGIASISYSGDGSLLASCSFAGDVILWRTDSAEPVHTFQSHQSTRNDWKAFGFHPQASVIAVSGGNDKSLDIYELDASYSGGLVSREISTYYRNAKVILLGDTGVGKSGLGLALLGEPWSAQESTHGRRVWILSRQVHLRDDGREEIREILLWDLAGQPDYRIIHQLHLSEVAIAIVVVDSRSQSDPFSGVAHWVKALKQARRIFGGTSSRMKTLLVAAREDVGRVSVSEARLTSFLKEMNFDEWHRTSVVRHAE